MGDSIKEMLWGETRVLEVANVEAAVELAQELKSSGEYDWFRGQARELPPYSTLHRAMVREGEVGRQKAERRIGLFCQWLTKIPELADLLEPENVHQCFAILQHYGIPTHYIDFTTDPAIAGFFAADTKEPPTEGRSVIYCLNIKNLLSVWSDLVSIGERKGASIETIAIDVRNLWRLQAQQGVFVFATYNWDVDYPLDRITFPYSGFPTYPTHDRVYPEHKSPLEQRLDQYFALEQSTFTNEMIEEMFERIRSQGGHATIKRWSAWEGGFYPEAFLDPSRLEPLGSWTGAASSGWEVDPEEEYHDTAGRTLHLKLKRTQQPEEIRKALSFAVKQVLRSEPGIRSKAVDWVFQDLAEPLSSDRLNQLLRPAWNGMRRLPYSDAEIADAFGAIVVLLLSGFQRGAGHEVNAQAFTGCFGDSIDVGFAYRDGSDSRGWVTRKGLVDAMRPDMADLLVQEHRQRPSDPRELFRVIYNPSITFEFDSFKRVFAREVIPAQVLLERSPTLFNPVQLMIFGNL